jgi:hypothetical protein
MKWISRCRKLIVGIVLRAFAWRKSEIERVAANTETSNPHLR